MQLTALVDSPDHVCCRYRLAAFASHLKKAGHELRLESLPRSSFARLRMFRGLAGHTVILQRKLLSFWERTWLRQRAARLVFDFDDAVFLRDSYSPKGLHHPSRLRRFARVMRQCDAVVAGNSYLAEEAARWLDRKRVHVIPTCVAPEKYPVAAHRVAGEGVRLIWIGSSSTLKGLEAVTPLLEELGRAVFGLRLQMVCDRFIELQNLPVIATPWSEATEAADIAGADIGISWVPDDRWSLGKCGLKVLQYMAGGLPVVTNPVGVHREMVVHGETGFLTTTAEEWVAAVRQLAANPELRRRMGAAGRQRLIDHYSVEQGARKWTELLAGLGQRAACAS